MRLAAIAVLALALSGCQWATVYRVGSVAHKAGCAATTAEGRAEIRAKQRVKTNVCGDDID